MLRRCNVGIYILDVEEPKLFAPDPFFHKFFRFGTHLKAMAFFFYKNLSTDFCLSNDSELLTYCCFLNESHTITISDLEPNPGSGSD